MGGGLALERRRPCCCAFHGVFPCSPITTLNEDKEVLAYLDLRKEGSRLLILSKGLRAENSLCIYINSLFPVLFSSLLALLSTPFN